MAPAGGSVEFPVDTRDFDVFGAQGQSEREIVAHACWRYLFNVPEKNRLTGDRNRVSVVLRNLCDTLGVEKVKAKFTETIQFERMW